MRRPTRAGWPGRSWSVRDQALATDSDQSATYVELFFDLVFVYAVTQLVVMLAADPTWEGAGRAAVVGWLVWWAWTQYTWALNSADTTHPWIEVGVLAGTAAAFFMAVNIAGAYGDTGIWFAAMYVAVRAIGLAMYGAVAWSDTIKRRAVARFTALSTFGFAAVVIGGAVEGDARVWWWVGAIVLDLVAATLAGTDEGWDIRPMHFSERHALFVIITLGESLITAAAVLTDAQRTTALVVMGGLAVATTCALWWCYFARARARLGHAVARATGAARSALARNVYSFLHFPIAFGVVLVAVAVKKGLAAPGAPPSDAVLATLLGGVVLYVGSMAVALGLAEGRVPWHRPIALGAIVGGCWLVRDEGIGWSFACVLLGVVLIALLEQHPDDRAADRGRDERAEER